MKNLFRLTLLILAVSSLNANASYSIKSVELIDSTVIDGSQISALTVHDSDTSLESIETIDGNIIKNSSVKSIHFSNSTNSNSHFQTSSKAGGEGTGG